MEVLCRRGLGVVRLAGRPGGSDVPEGAVGSYALAGRPGKWGGARRGLWGRTPWRADPVSVVVPGGGCGSYALAGRPGKWCGARRGLWVVRPGGPTR